MLGSVGKDWRATRVERAERYESSVVRRVVHAISGSSQEAYSTLRELREDPPTALWFNETFPSKFRLAAVQLSLRSGLSLGQLIHMTAKSPVYERYRDTLQNFKSTDVVLLFIRGGDIGEWVLVPGWVAELPLSPDACTITRSFKEEVPVDGEPPATVTRQVRMYTADAVLRYLEIYKGAT